MDTISPEIWRELEATAQQAATGVDPGHDMLHVRRVVANARVICAAEGADPAVVLPAALLHELFNYPKDHPDSARSGEVCAEHAIEVLSRVGYPSEAIPRIAYAIRVHPFSLGIVPTSLDARVLQDADRLDALGAIGIARVFSTGSVMARPFYAEHDPFCVVRVPNDKEFTVDHFYRKLLKLPDAMHTATGRQMATHRADFLRAYLTQLDAEIRTIGQSAETQNAA